MTECEDKEMISIIVPIYNSKRYIEKCIKSILNQTYKNLEIILIDDGSFDGSSIICDKYKMIDSRIRVIHQKNQGVSVVRNVGIRSAKGDYIAFVDSDDYVLPEMYELLLNSIKKNNVLISFCDIYFEQNNKRYTLSNDLKGSIVSWRKAMKEAFLDRGSFSYSVNKLFKREIFFNNKIFFDSEKALSEDTDIIYKLFYCAETLSYVNIPLYVYVQHPSSTIRTLSIQKRICVLDVAEKALKFDAEHGANARKEILIWKVRQLYGLFMLILTSKTADKKDFIIIRKEIIDIINKQEIKCFLEKSIGKHKIIFIKYFSFSFIFSKLLYNIYNLLNYIKIMVV